MKIAEFGEAMKDCERYERMKAELNRLADAGDPRVVKQAVRAAGKTGEGVTIRMPRGPYKRRRLQKFLGKVANG